MSLTDIDIRDKDKLTDKEILEIIKNWKQSVFDDELPLIQKIILYILEKLGV